MKDNDDIWSGSSLKKSGDPVGSWETEFMINRGRFCNQEASGLSTILMCVGLAIVAIFAVYFSVCGPSMWHNALVVCSGSKCTTYTEWKVIGEDQTTGVLEVWAGGRLHRRRRSDEHLLCT